jgi:hypothetical protein
MTPSPPLIFTPPMLTLLGLEPPAPPDPSSTLHPNESSPYPFVIDPATKAGIFFNPLGCLVSFRMLARALTRMKASISVIGENDSIIATLMVADAQDESTVFSSDGSLDMVDCFTLAAFMALDRRISALASP